MKLLAMDSCTQTASVAIQSEGQLLAEVFLDVGLKHSETLQTAVEQLLALSQLRYQDLDGFVCTKGPGSFTGLRIGLSLCQTLAFATGKPCAGFSSLEVMAASELREGKGLVLALLDARNRRAYSALYQIEEGSLRPLLAEKVGALEDLYAELRALSVSGQSLYLVGDLGGLASKEDFLSILEERGLHLINHSKESLRASVLASYAEACLTAQPERWNSAKTLEASYLNLTQAERERGIRV